MKKLLLALALFATPAFAQEFEVGARHLIVSTSSDDAIEIGESRGFAATAELFVSPRFSTELSAGFINPQATLADGTDLGTLGVNTTALTARWNLAPHALISLFAGAGVAYVRVGNLDDQTDERIEVDFDSEVTYVAEAGARLRLRRARRLALVGTISYMPLKPELNVRRSNVALPKELTLDPMTIGIGATWRF